MSTPILYPVHQARRHGNSLRLVKALLVGSGKIGSEARKLQALQRARHSRVMIHIHAVYHGQHLLLGLAVVGVATC
jgi:hypothetical protein